MTALTTAHRDAQAQLALDTVAQIVALWPLLDLEDLDGTFARWVRAVKRVIDAQHDRSSRTAAAYYQALRGARAPRDAAPFLPVLADALDGKALTQSMLVAGPVKVKQILASGRGIEQAAQVAMTHSAGVASRHAVSGGRDTVVASARKDPSARGYARVGAGQCAFCAMLIARGPVYSSEGSATFEAHTGCKCTAEPVFGDSYDGKAHADTLRERLADEPFTPKRYAGPSKALAEAQTPAPLTPAQVAEKADRQAAWAKGHGWETRLDGRVLTGTKPDGASIAWELQDNGAWRVSQHRK